MNFEYNEDQLAIKEMAKNFSETEFKPYASEWDQKEIFPVEALKKAAEPVSYTHLTLPTILLV